MTLNKLCFLLVLLAIT